MRTTHTINITIEDGKIIGMDIIQDGYSRTEFVTEKIDEPITLNEAIDGIREYFE
jgi:hypothetical protein